MNFWIFRITWMLAGFVFWVSTFTPSERIALESAFLVLVGVAGEYIAEIKPVENRKWLEKKVKQFSMAILIVGLAGDVFGIVMGQAEMQALIKQAGDAATNAKNALADAGNAKAMAKGASDTASGANQIAGEAKTIAGEANGTASAVETKAGILSGRIDDEFSRLKAITPRFVALRDSSKDLIELAGQSPKQKVGFEMCGASPPSTDFIPFPKFSEEIEEEFDVGQVLFETLSQKGGWSAEAHDFWTNCGLPYRYGVRVFVNKSAPSSAQKAAYDLSESLSRILPPQYDLPFLSRCGVDLTMSPDDNEAPCILVARNPRLIIVLIGRMPAPWGINEIPKNIPISHPK